MRGMNGYVVRRLVVHVSRSIKDVIPDGGVLGVPYYDTTTPFSPTIAVNLVVLQPDLVRAVLVADVSAATGH